MYQMLICFYPGCDCQQLCSNSSPVPSALRYIPPAYSREANTLNSRFPAPRPSVTDLLFTAAGGHHHCLWTFLCPATCRATRMDQVQGHHLTPSSAMTFLPAHHTHIPPVFLPRAVLNTCSIPNTSFSVLCVNVPHINMAKRKHWLCLAEESLQPSPCSPSISCTLSPVEPAWLSVVVQLWCTWVLIVSSSTIRRPRYHRAVTVTYSWCEWAASCFRNTQQTSISCSFLILTRSLFEHLWKALYK